jgi:hypothetical protein
MRRTLTVFLFLASLLYTGSAYAQDTRPFGVTMGYPASVGVLWHVTEGVAVRPEFSFDVFSSETENSSPLGGDSSSDGNSVSVGLSALFYLARWDMTRAYVVPRYAYSRTTQSIDGPFTVIGDSTGNAHDVSVSFGAQHTLEIGSPSTVNWASRTNGQRPKSPRRSCTAALLARAAALASLSTSERRYRPSGIPGRGALVGGTDWISSGRSPVSTTIAWS